MKVCLVDNYDSFSFNLFQFLAEEPDVEVTVVKNDETIPGGLNEFDAFVISPGPGHPERQADFGLSREVISHGDRPTLGVCLGHQGIVTLFGGEVSKAPEPVHGRISEVTHVGTQLFDKIPNKFNVVRYHSLAAVEPLPEQLVVTARSNDNIVMAIQHKKLPLWGVQFHPESIYCEHGKKLLSNFLALAREFNARQEETRRKVLLANTSQQRIPTEWRVQYTNWSTDLASDEVFERLYSSSDPSFWLDTSAMRQGMTRFSYMGDLSGPHSTLLTQTDGPSCAANSSADLLSKIQQSLSEKVIGGSDLPFDFVGGYVGYLGYEMRTETARAPVTKRTSLPDATMMFVDRVIVYDHQAHQIYAVTLSKQDDDPELATAWTEQIATQLRKIPAPACHLPPRNELTFTLEQNLETYTKSIRTSQQHITNGESYEICLTNRIRTYATVDPLILYKSLRHANPAPYAAFLRLGETTVHCSSPERFVKIGRNRVVEAKPIKGTRPRSQNAAQDLELARDLACSEKDRAENLMITDLLRNDLGKVCEIGSVWTPKLMDVESYATVHQLVSTVRGVLAPSADSIDLIHATFPPGSMTGAPKERTLEIIDSLENSARGIYSGTLGFFSMNGSADFNVVIRTIVQQGDQLEVGVGGAIISLSDESEEFDETIVKGLPMMRAISRAVTGSPDQFLIRNGLHEVTADELLNRNNVAPLADSFSESDEPSLVISL